jgi:hypothetical protein
MDKVNYMQNVPVTLDAILVDLEKQIHFQKKQSTNQSITEFDGFIQLVDAGQEYDLKFKTPTSSFKISWNHPTVYAANLDNVKTTGDFTVIGFTKVVLIQRTKIQY